MLRLDRRILGLGQWSALLSFANGFRAHEFLETRRGENESASRFPRQRRGRAGCRRPPTLPHNRKGPPILVFLVPPTFSPRHRSNYGVAFPRVGVNGLEQPA